MITKMCRPMERGAGCISHHIVKCGIDWGGVTFDHHISGVVASVDAGEWQENHWFLIIWGLTHCWHHQCASCTSEQIIHFGHSQCFVTKQPDRFAKCTARMLHMHVVFLLWNCCSTSVTHSHWLENAALAIGMMDEFVQIARFLTNQNWQGLLWTKCFCWIWPSLSPDMPDHCWH